ncbi:glycine oxidase ThiO [Gayadomonas joobiniege]|uniref:glycine oxidase ThiO n=1 Tax=Gayadomonas joobiniege TaxID=1234606 RepID=UPI0003819E95|nr:glycine oxidase ThiO [Gayadomonas joobiniege]
MANESAKIALIGGGLIGRLLAWQLKNENPNYQVELYEKQAKDGQQSAAYVAAAMLAPLAESIVAGPLVNQLGKQSVALWQALLAQLPEPVFIQQAGTLVIAHQQDAGDLKSFRQRLGTGAELRELTRAGIAELEPQLAGRFNQGLWLPSEGQLDNRQLLRVLTQALDDVGVGCFYQYEVCIKDNSVWHGAKACGEYDWIIDCRGLGAKSNLKGLRGVRGEVARVRSQEVQLHRPIRLMHPRYPIYIAPKPDHEFVIGATEIESENQRPVTVRSTLELLSAAYSVQPAFAEAELISLQTGLRPTLSDNEPSIDVTNRLITVNGLYRHGYLIGPAMIQQVMLKLVEFGLQLNNVLLADGQIYPPVFRHIERRD